MLVIHDQVLMPNQLKSFLTTDSTIHDTARDILSSIIPTNTSEYFYNSKKMEYDYKILVTTKEELEIYMKFFKLYPLVNDEYICIKRMNLTLKETYEIIDKYSEFDFVDKIYVEQLDKNEWVNYEDYSIIYDFLKSFDSMLPDNPTTMDIIINAYDYVKQREYFAENDRKSLLSKQFSTSVLTPYIVCAGFVKQFNCILKEYNIPCFEYQFMNKNNIGHDVSMVHIDGLGIYFFDITSDSFTRKDQSDHLKNEAKYSGFMLPYTYYLNNKIYIDNFSKELLKNPKFFETRKRYANQQIIRGNDEEIDIFNEDEFKNTYLLQTLVDVDFELLKNDNLFQTVSDNREMMTAEIYNALLKINNSFGTEVIDVDLFIDMLMSAKRNSDLKDNDRYYKKAIISRYIDNPDINLSDSMNIVVKKLKR